MQAGNHQFLNYDDNAYVTSNPHVAGGLTGKNIIWAFTSVYAWNWHPITWLSHMVDVEFYDMNPRGHHLTNVAIHAVSSLLLLLFLFRFTGSLWKSSFVAALFALHPLHVESVAWVAERKDVLSALFWFITLFLYSEYVAKLKPMLYILSLFSFVLGLLSKPMLVTLPVVLLLIDFWPLNRYQHEEQERGIRQLSGRAIALIKEKIPFFLCSVISAVVTIYAQNKGVVMENVYTVPFGHSIENALISYVKYIGKTIWPHDLAVLYPMPLSFPLWQVVCSLLILLLLSAATVWAARRFPYLAVGWFWFLITLFPVIGLIQFGMQSMADRYSYIPVTGLFIMVAWGVPDLTKGLKRREGILALLAGAVIIASAALTWQQLGYWRDNISLFQHTLQVTKDNYVIMNNLGLALAEKGQVDAAIQEYQEGLRINPNVADLRNNLGIALAEKGDLAGAMQEYREALQISPNYTDAHNNLGLALAGERDLDAAIQEYREALRTSPNDMEAHNNLGLALAGKGDLDAAIREYREALQISPDFAAAHNDLGVALASKGDLDSAIQEFQEVLRIDPNDMKAHNNLGLVLASKGDLDAAIQEYQEALRISPNETNVRNNLEDALAQKRLQDRAKK
ncbi:MAG: tetratricopeptide repeat protein [Dissulfurispiraceae bacterium]